MGWASAGESWREGHGLQSRKGPPPGPRAGTEGWGLGPSLELTWPPALVSRPLLGSPTHPPYRGSFKNANRTASFNVPLILLKGPHDSLSKTPALAPPPDITHLPTSPTSPPTTCSSRAFCLPPCPRDLAFAVPATRNAFPSPPPPLPLPPPSSPSSSMRGEPQRRPGSTSPIKTLIAPSPPSRCPEEVGRDARVRSRLVTAVPTTAERRAWCGEGNQGSGVEDVSGQHWGSRWPFAPSSRHQAGTLPSPLGAQRSH